MKITDPQLISDLAGLREWCEQGTLPDSRHRRLLKAVPEAMKMLTDRQRQLVEMYYDDQMLMKDIASELGLNISTVSRTLGRARERLREYLKFAL